MGSEKLDLKRHEHFSMGWQGNSILTLAFSCDSLLHYHICMVILFCRGAFGVCSLT